MRHATLLLLLLPLLAVVFGATTTAEKLPTVLVATLFRNKAPVLPYFFSFLDALDYPKDRIALWFRSDHNEDRTDDIILAWHRNATAAAGYHSIDLNALPAAADAPTRRPNETSPFDWPAERHEAIIELKQEALRYAKRIWADFVFFLDADVLLCDAQSLRYLVALNQPLVAPMLLSDGLYSNFWGGMSSNYYYDRTAEYKEIYEHRKSGEFAVPMVHSAVLINLRDARTDGLSFDRRELPAIGGGDGDGDDAEQLDVPQDDIIVLAVSANRTGVPMLVSNARIFGYVLVPLDGSETFEQDNRQLTNVKVMMINELGGGLEVLDVLRPFVMLPLRDTLGLDGIVMINLKRRPERRLKMEHNFNELGLQVELLPAVDGSLLTPARLAELGVEVLPAYADPYHKRPMTMGEIGCFLSHFWVWEEMLARGQKEVLVLEDDILFDTYFKQRVENLIDEAREIGGYDLIYLGRKRLQNQEEKYVGTSKNLVHPSYSYWTLGYIITLQGVQKLLAAEPLTKMLPIDEFLPIMFNQHVNTTWKSHFPERNLVAWSASPLLIFPTHYTGEAGYISDTEDSALLQQQREGAGDGAGELPSTTVDVNDELVEKKGKRENYEWVDETAAIEELPQEFVANEIVWESEDDPVEQAFLAELSDVLKTEL